MRKLLFVAVALAIVALQPTLAMAGTGSVGPTAPIVTTVNANILQVIPATATGAGLPALPPGIQDTSGCLRVDAATGRLAPNPDRPTITFVGNILCLDPGPGADFASYATGCPRGTTPVIQGVKLIKTEKLSPKCPDVFPGGEWVQTPVSTGIRTWWPLKHTPCETRFQLRVEFACVSAPGTNRGVPVQIRENVFNFTVKVLPSTLRWVVEALHVQPLGVCEVPCITDEALFALLLRQADAIATLAATAPPSTVALNTAIDTMEATIVANCRFLLSVAQVTTDAAGNITRILPCGALFPNSCPWGNYTVGAFGWGIVDTLENPCCCKLITDLYWLKTTIVGTDP